MEIPSGIDPNIGTILRFDSDGYILRPATSPSIAEPWKTVVEQSMEIIIKCLKSEIISIYLRGSVARNTAMLYTSDIDLIVIVRKNICEKKRIALEAALHELSSAKPFVTDIEVELYSKRSLLTSNIHNSTRFVLQNLSKLIFGQEILSTISRQHRSSVPLMSLPSLPSILSHTSDILRHHLSVDEKRTICRWVMKHLVRSGYELDLHAAPYYSRDLFPCAKLFVKRHRRWDVEMWQAVKLVVRPSSNLKVINNSIETLGESILRIRESRFKKEVAVAN